MAYEKFIKKGDKVYGPYIYHSKRIDGRVISEYHGSKKLNYKKTLLIVCGIFFLIAIIYVLFFSEKEITGRAVFDLNADYTEGAPMDGKLKLSLQEGELIPATSTLIFNNNGNSYEYNLKNLVSEEPISGDFYVQGTGISGTGEGYGIEGEKKIYLKVYFILSILSEQEKDSESTEITESAQEEQTTENTTQQKTTTETQPESTTEETAPITGGVISKLFKITGNAVVEFEREITGEVSGEEIFSYTLQEGERVEIKPRSVRTDSEQLSDSDINLEVKDNEVVVTTEYYETENGFGKDYLGNNTKEIVIDISDLGLILNKGSLKVSLVDSDKEILSLTTILEQGEVSANETVEQPVSEEIIEKPIPEINENISEIQTNMTIPETTFLPEVFELTEAERAVLIQKFGNIIVKVTEATEQRGFITIRYEIGGYWAEYSYNSNLRRETLDLFMEKDKVKWLKDIAKSLSQEEEAGQNLEEFLGNSSV
ncbi:MAG: hypothetical protein ABIH65_03275 [Nanoarchaeota archaeon]